MVRRDTATALVVPVADARAAVEAAGGQDLEAATGLPPHITILYPFVDTKSVDADLTTALAGLVGRCERFPFRLSRLGRFPDRVTYLSPEPPEPFVALTEAVWRRWPSHPPYDGAYEAVVPHLTVFEGVEPPGLISRLAPLLPVDTTAGEVALLRRATDGHWSFMERFPLARTSTGPDANSTQ